MILEIVAGLLIAGIILYGFYLYLGWCDKYSAQKTLYAFNKAMVLKDAKAVIEQYGQYILPETLSDTYKPIRFQVLYYQNKYLT